MNDNANKAIQNMIWSEKAFLSDGPYQSHGEKECRLDIEGSIYTFLKSEGHADVAEVYARVCKTLERSE